MKILVDELPKEPKDCPYSYENGGKCWCNFRMMDSSNECKNTDNCFWFSENKQSIKVYQKASLELVNLGES